MPRAPISIAGLMGGVLVAGIGLAGLVAGTRLWHQTIYTLTVLLLFLAAIAARYRRPFWFGFAIVGWGYLLLGLGPWFSPFDRPSIMRSSLDSESRRAQAFATKNDNLLTSDWLHRFCMLVTPPVDPVIPRTPESDQIRTLHFVYRIGIGHSFLSLLFAAVGGVAAEILARPARRIAPIEASGDQSTNRNSFPQSRI